MVLFGISFRYTHYDWVYSSGCLALLLHCWWQAVAVVLSGWSSDLAVLSSCILVLVEYERWLLATVVLTEMCYSWNLYCWVFYSCSLVLVLYWPWHAAIVVGLADIRHCYTFYGWAYFSAFSGFFYWYYIIDDDQHLWLAEIHDSCTLCDWVVSSSFLALVWYMRGRAEAVVLLEIPQSCSLS